jgi:hypothetical protein
MTKLHFYPAKKFYNLEIVSSSLIVCLEYCSAGHVGPRTVVIQLWLITIIYDPPLHWFESSI